MNNQKEQENSVSFSRHTLVNMLKNLKNEIIDEFSHKRGYSEVDAFINNHLTESYKNQGENKDDFHLKLSKDELKKLLKKYGEHLNSKISNEKTEVYNKEMEYYQNYINFNNLLWFYYNYDRSTYTKLIDEYNNRLHNKLLTSLGLPPTIPEEKTFEHEQNPNIHEKYVPQYNLSRKRSSLIALNSEKNHSQDSHLLNHDTRNSEKTLGHDSQKSIKELVHHQNQYDSQAITSLNHLDLRTSEKSQQLPFHRDSYYLPPSHLPNHRKSKSHQQIEFFSNRLSENSPKNNLNSQKSFNNIHENEATLASKKYMKTPYLRGKLNNEEENYNLPPVSSTNLKSGLLKERTPFLKEKITHQYEKTPMINEKTPMLKEKSSKVIEKTPWLKPNKHEPGPPAPKSLLKIPSLEENNFVNFKINSPLLNVGGGSRHNEIKLPEIHIRTPNGHSKRPTIEEKKASFFKK